MATRGKISELYDIEKIKAQQTEVLGYVDEFVRQVSNTKPIRVKLEGAEKTKEVVKGISELGLAVKQYGKLVDQTAVGQAKLSALESDYAKKVAGTKVQLQQKNKELTIEAQLQNASANSLEYAAAMVKKLTNERNKLDLSTADGRKRQAELNAELDKYNQFITENNDKQTQQTRNVGNYGQALKTLEAYLADVRQQLAATQKAATGLTISAAPGPAVRGNNSAPLRAADNSRQVVAYTKSIEQASDRVADLAKQEQLLSRIVESQIAGYASATAEIKNNEKALQALEAAGLKNSEFYQVLLKDTAELKDSVGDLKDEIKALASDTRQIDLVTSAVTGLVSAFQVGASVGELFAGSNEDIQKSIQRLTALQNIAQGIQQIANDLTTKGTALNKIYNFIIGEGAKTRATSTAATVTNTVATEANAAATEAATVATTGLTTATKVLRGALIASGVGLLVAGIIYLISKLEEWRDADINLIKHQAELNQVTLESIRLNKELADITRTDIGTEIQALKNKVAANQAYGRSQGEVLAAEEALLKARQKAANIKFFDTNGAGKLRDLETDLKNAAKAVDTFNQQQAAIPIGDRDEKQADAQRALLQSTLDLAKEKYAEQKVIVDDYYNYNNEVISKQLQIERLNADERRKYALQSATLSANAIIDANQRALNNEAATLKQRIALMQSTAEQQKKIAEAQNADVQNDPGASGKEKLMAARDLAFQLNKIEKDSLEAQRQLREEYRKRDMAAELEMVRIRFEAQAAANDRIAQDETKSFNERTDALYVAMEKRRAILLAQYEFEKQAAGLTAEEREKIEVKYLNDINALTIQYGLDQVSLYKSNGELVAAEIERQVQKRLDIITAGQDKEILALNERLRAKLISQVDYENQRANIEANALLLSLQQEVNVATAKVLATKEGTAERAAAEKELFEKTKQYSDLLLSDEQRKNIIKLEKTKTTIDAIGQMYQNLYAVIGEALSLSADKERSRIEQQLSDLDKATEKEIESVNATVSNEEEKKAKINEINQKAAAKKELLDQRQRQLDLEKARFDKAANVANIITGTALAVVNTLKDERLIALGLAIPLATTVGVLGGIQLVRALAAPLPKYAEGTDDAAGGLSWVGDGGKKELVIEPSGKTYKTPATPTVMDIPKHSVILPDADTVMRDLELVAMSNIAKALSTPITEKSYGAFMTKEISNRLDRLTNVVANKHELHIKPGFNSIMAIHKYGSRWNKRINEQTKF